MESSAVPGHDLDVPDSVGLSAQRGGLGSVVGVRHEPSTGSMVLSGVVTAAVGLVLTFVLAAVNAAQDASADPGGTTHHFFAPTGAITLIGLGIALRGLLIGTRAHYLYTGGLVHGRRSGNRVSAWSEIHALHAAYGRDTSAVVGYRVESLSDRSVLVPLHLVDGRDLFVDRLLALAEQHHVTID